MAKKVDSFPISAKWVYIYSLSGVNLKATNGQIFSLPSGFFALSRDEIQKFFTNNYITVEYDDEDVGFTLFCYDFAVVGIQPASDITMAGLVQVSSDTNLQVKKIVGSSDEIKSLVDSISGALTALSGDISVDSKASISLLTDLKDSLAGLAVVIDGMSSAQGDGNSSLAGIDTKVDAIGGNTTAANSLLQNIKDELTKAYTACESLITGQGVGNTSLSAIKDNLDTLNTAVSNINTYIDTIGGNTTAANSLLSNIKDELTRVYTVCQSILEKGVDSTITDIDTKVDAIGGNTTAANSLLQNIKDELIKVYTVCQSILEKGVDSTITDIDTKVDVIGGNTTAANSLLQNIKDELTKAYTACESLIAGQGVGNASLSAIKDNFDTLNTAVSNINTYIDTIGANSTAANSLLSGLKDEVTKVYTVCQSILEKGVDSTVTDIDTKVDAIGASVVALNSTASGSKDELTKIYTATQSIITNQTAISTALSGLDTKVNKLVESSESIIALLGVMSGISENLFNMNFNIEILIRTLNTVSAGVQLIANNSELAEVVNVGQLQAVYNANDKCFEVRGIPSTATKFEGSFVFQNNRLSFSRPKLTLKGGNVSCPYLPFVTFNINTESFTCTYSSGSFSLPVKFFNDLGGLIEGVSFDSSSFSSSIVGSDVGFYVDLFSSRIFYCCSPDFSFVDVIFSDGALCFSCDSSGSLSGSAFGSLNSSSYLDFDNSKAISFSKT